MKCRAMLKVMAPTRYMFFHTGNLSKLSFSESEFIALNISTVTRIDKLIVVARCAITFVNISHPISGNAAEHSWK
jgi:TPP-dependent trihydroxycyclohexane-1,2-dione (THcHDO) dehydratase